METILAASFQNDGFSKEDVPSERLMWRAIADDAVKDMPMPTMGVNHALNRWARLALPILLGYFFWKSLK